jgi:SOS response regulatory protein OraA/RecX
VARPKQTKEYKRVRIETAKKLIEEKLGNRSLKIAREKYASYNGNYEKQKEIYRLLLDNGFNFSEVGKLARKSHEAVRKMLREKANAAKVGRPKKGHRYRKYRETLSKQMIVGQFGQEALAQARAKLSFRNGEQLRERQKEIYSYLLSRGFNFSEIGKLAGKSHETIRHLMIGDKNRVVGVEEEEEEEDKNFKPQSHPALDQVVAEHVREKVGAPTETEKKEPSVLSVPVPVPVRISPVPDTTSLDGAKEPPAFSGINVKNEALNAVENRSSRLPIVAFALALAILLGLGFWQRDKAKQYLAGIIPNKANQPALSTKTAANGENNDNSTAQVTQNITEQTETTVTKGEETGTATAHVIVEVVGGNQNTNDTNSNNKIGDVTNITNVTNATTGTPTALTAGNGIAVNGGQVSVAGNYSGQGSISNVGSITSGTWQGGVIQDAYVADNITASNYIPTDANFGGDVSGNYDNLTVTDDSHTHTAATLPANTSYLGSSIETGEITDDTLLEADLHASNAPNNAQILTYNAATGGFTWVDAGGGVAYTAGAGLDLVGAEFSTDLLSTGGLQTSGVDNELGIKLDGGTLTLGAGGLKIADTYDDNFLTTSTTFGGDVSGAYNNIAVANDSHSHTAATLPAATSYLGSSIGTAEIENDAVTLGTLTSGNYVASVTNGSGISGGNGGSEGAALTLALGALSADWSQTGAYDITLNNESSELNILESVGATFYGTLDVGDLAADATYTFSGTSGTVITSANYASTLSHDSISGAGTVDTAGEVQGVSVGGDLSGTVGNAAVTDDSHSHTAATLPASTSYLGSSIESAEITDDTILEANLHASNSPNNAQVLAYNSATGGFTWADDQTGAGGGVTNVATGSGLSGGPITTTGTISLGALTADWQQNGAYDVILQNASSELKIKESAGDTYYGIFDVGDLAADATYTFSGASGTVYTSANDPFDTSGEIQGVSLGGSLGGTIGSATIGSDAVTLTTNTTGNYVANVANGSGITGGSTGSEGAALTLALGALTGDWVQSGAYDIKLANASSELRVMESSGDTYYGTLDVGDLSADATYTLAGPTGNVLTSTTEPILTTTGRHSRVLEFTPEYSGATMATYYGTGTDTSITGSMNSDVETGNPLHNYYEWNSSEAALNGYTVSFSVSLPSDFDAWADTNAIQIYYKTETASDADNKLEFYIYDATNAAITSSTSGNASTSWAAASIDDSSLVGWSTANARAFIFVRMRSMSDNFARVGEIRLNYLSKW